MKRTTLLGGELNYRVGQMAMQDTQNYNDETGSSGGGGSVTAQPYVDERVVTNFTSNIIPPVTDEQIYSGGGSTSSTSNILPPVSENTNVDIILTPSVITYDNNNNSNADASIQPTGTAASNVLTTDAVLTPVTPNTPAYTTTTAKMNKNWWWLLAAGAVLYKISRK